MANYSDGYITGRKLPEWLKKEINDRGNAKPSEKWKVSKKPWMTLNSFSSEPMELADYEKRTKDDFYTKTEEGRLVPQPAINSVEVTTTGTVGSMRKTTVKFTVYSIKQLRQAQRAYFVPGVTAVCQWGWNIQSDGSTITRLTEEDITGAKSMYELQQKITKKSESNKGNTEGVCGLISDFNWNYDPNSKAYTCEITIDSPGKAFVSGDVHVAGAKQHGGCKQDEEQDGGGNWMKIALKDIAESNIENRGDNVWVTGKTSYTPKGRGSGFGLELDEDGKEDASWWSKVTGFFGSAKKNYYVTWAWWESTIISGLAPVADAHAKADDLSYKKGGPLFKTNAINWGKKQSVWRLDSSTSRMKIPSDGGWQPYASCDPWVCIIPGNAHWEEPQAKKGSNHPKAQFGIAHFGGYMPMPKACSQRNSNLKVKDGIHYMELGKICLNTWFLWHTFQETKTIDEYVMAVGRKVNEVCGGFWDLELVDDPKDPSTMRLIDRNYTPKPSAVGTQDSILNLVGNTSARNWGISTDIPQATRHMVMMGTQKKSNSQPNTNLPQGSTLDYAEGIECKMMGKQQLDNKRNQGEGCQPDTGTKSFGQKPDGLAELKERCKEAMGALAQNRSDEAVDSALGTMKAYHNAKGKNSPSTYGGVTIPVGLDLTLDGIGGFSWGYYFETDYTPKIVKKEHCFQVTHVKHSVSQDDWTTKLESNFRLKD